MIGVQNHRFFICDDFMEIRDEVVFITIKRTLFQMFGEYVIGEAFRKFGATIIRNDAEKCSSTRQR